MTRYVGLTFHDEDIEGNWCDRMADRDLFRLCPIISLCDEKDVEIDRNVVVQVEIVSIKIVPTERALYIEFRTRNEMPVGMRHGQYSLKFECLVCTVLPDEMFTS